MRLPIYPHSPIVQILLGETGSYGKWDKFSRQFHGHYFQSSKMRNAVSKTLLESLIYKLS